MTTSSFTTALSIDQSPEKVFHAINNVRGWWSEEIEGATEKLNDEFTYHYKDVHRCKMKLIEVIPNKKVVWQVLDNYFNFTQDKTEWTGTKIIFEISKQKNKTQLHFTHLGLVPDYECYAICNDSWNNYITMSLRSLIITGEGQPNRTDTPRTENEKILSKHKKIEIPDYHTSITVDAPSQEVFKNINQVSKWWTENLEGHSQKLNDEFTVRFDDVHVSTQKLIEVIPSKKIVWLVTDSRLNFIKDKQEWTGTKICFDIIEKDNKTQINFTHAGLAPDVECYKDCALAWGEYIKGSLFKLLTEGKGTPALKIK